MKLHALARLAALSLAAVSLGGLPLGASALPVTISNVEYLLDRVGTNTIGIAGGGSPTGVITALFDATTSPGSTQGTTATASQGGIATGAPVAQANPAEWARRIVNPTTAQLQPLTVFFQNGSDVSSVTTGSLVGVNPVALVTDLQVDTSASVFSPTVRWSLPEAIGFDIDAIQLVFYSDATNLEIGNRVTLASSARSFTFSSLLPAGLDLTINVRLYDLKDPSGGVADVGNILASSRTYVNYSVPAVPEPTTGAFLLGGVGALALWQRRRRHNRSAVA